MKRTYEQWVRAKQGRRHRHVWIRSAAYDSLETWAPVAGLMFCDVPQCQAVRVPA